MAKTYYTIQGDMWDGIAKKLYDDESGVNALLEANQQYADIVVFQQVLFWMCRIMKAYSDQLAAAVEALNGSTQNIDDHKI